MGYLDDSSGPQLVPPIPDLTPFLNRRPGFGLIWNGDLARTVRYADRYQIPEELVPYFVDHPERYFEYREVNRIPSDFDYYFPPYRSDELDIHRRSVYWTLALFIVAHELLNQAILPPGYPLDVAVGYLDPHNEVDAFGLAISVDPEDMSYAILPPEPTHLYSLPIVRDRHVRLPLLYGWPDQEGPVIVRRPREYMRHPASEVQAQHRMYATRQREPH